MTSLMQAFYGFMISAIIMHSEMLEKRFDIVKVARGNALQVFNEALIAMIAEPAIMLVNVQRFETVQERL